jgi:hypothetical protein
MWAARDVAQRWQQDLETLPPDVRAEYEAVRQGEERSGRLVDKDRLPQA